jgi:hypothetical protein
LYSFASEASSQSARGGSAAKENDVCKRDAPDHGEDEDSKMNEPEAEEEERIAFLVSVLSSSHAWQQKLEFNDSDVEKCRNYILNLTPWFVSLN